MSEKVPNIKWAQRKALILLKVEIQGATDDKIELTEKRLTVSATSSMKENYKVTVDLFAECVPGSLVKTIQPRYINIVFKKQDEDADFWPRLTEKKAKYHYIAIDWNQWKDEDEDDDENEEIPGMEGMGGMPGGMPGGMDFASMMQGMGGMGGMPPGMDFGGMNLGGMDLGGDDDDGPPELENDDDDAPPALEDDN
mmetsp:Transcript_21734/g.37125  ORF Transcript_21734/g.37125 Transcript_21734/m.37125 type:complete len:196 (+) Transcript_21734:31-618(+)